MHKHTGLYPKSKFYILGVQAILNAYPHLASQVGADEPQLTIKLKIKFSNFRLTDGSNSPQVKENKARYTPKRKADGDGDAKKETPLKKRNLNL